MKTSDVTSSKIPDAGVRTKTIFAVDSMTEAFVEEGRPILVKKVKFFKHGNIVPGYLPVEKEKENQYRCLAPKRVKLRC